MGNNNETNDPVCYGITAKIDKAYKKIIKEQRHRKAMLIAACALAKEGDATAKEWLWENYNLKIIL